MGCVCITGCQLLGSMFVFWGVFTPLTSSMLLLNAILIVYPRFFFDIYLFLCCLTIHVLIYYLEHVHFVLATTLIFQNTSAFFLDDSPRTQTIPPKWAPYFLALTPWHPGFDPYCSILYIYIPQKSLHDCWLNSDISPLWMEKSLLKYFPSMIVG